MGVCTQMFVATKKEAILEVMPKVISGLNKWLRCELTNYVNSKEFENISSYLFRDKSQDASRGLKHYSNGITLCSTCDFGSFRINFVVNGESRTLFITHTCSNDYSEVYKGDKLIFSLGCFGMSEKIMLLVVDIVKEFGDVYYTPNDFSQPEFQKIECGS